MTDYRFACSSLFVLLLVIQPIECFVPNPGIQEKAEGIQEELEKNKGGSRRQSSKTNIDDRTVEAGKSVSRKYQFKEAEKQMEYQLYLPGNYYDEIEKNAKKKFPLIIALHGYGSNPKQIVGYPGFTRRANKRGYLIAAPMGYNTRGWYGSRGQGGGYGKTPRNLGELSEKDVLNVLEITRKDFQVDENKIYLYGHSMGGGGSIHLAMKYPEIWAAVAPMAPAIPRGMKDLGKAKHTPFFIVHGDNDKVLPVKNTRSLIEKMKELKIDHQYREVEKGDHVTVAWRYFDEIFDFFDKHKK